MKKYVIKIIIIFIIILFSGCSLPDIEMQKFPYYGNALRFDGYYQSEQTDFVLFFYRDGTVLKIDKSEISINSTVIDTERVKTDKRYWGTLQIQEPQIEFEIIQFMSDFYGLFHYYGIIDSNESFYITKYVSQKRNIQNISNENFSFKFYSSEKPDSINQCIKW
ncbi:MAG: hypothetical protein LBN95_01885 [Prevotellaceae bacterium]|jgi:hypothetical protein|nr:hypothetical protein [Prevotellaceae bacterium]